MKPNDYTYGLLWNVNCEPYQFTDKNRAINNYVRYMLNRLQGLFSYEGLPETIPARNLELLLQVNGSVTIADVNGSLYAFRGGLGGEPDPYYMPTISVVANPALKLSKTYTINEDCIVIPNDALYTGLMPLLRRYCTSLVENDITMNLADIMMRMVTLLTADDDATKYAAEKYIKDIIEGKLSVIKSKKFIDDNSLQTQPYASTGQGNQVTQLIEYEQYLKASMLNELGIQMNWNSKRESINGEEAGMNNQSLLPLIYDMYQQRKEGVERVNDMFGTSISVRFGYPWLDTVDDPIEDETKEDVKEDEPDVDEQAIPASDSVQEND